jgi:transcriptional regulator with XRE-family HTH domain
METTEVTGSELRRRLAAKGLRMADLAMAANLFPANLSAILNGQVPIGATRRARLEHAIAKLGLDEAAPEPTPPPSDPIFRIQRDDAS